MGRLAQKTILSVGVEPVIIAAFFEKRTFGGSSAAEQLAVAQFQRYTYLVWQKNEPMPSEPNN